MTSQPSLSASGPLSDAIKTDHREIFEYYSKYTDAGSRGDVDAQERWANQLIWEVARHSAGEEIVVYPFFEKYLGVRGREIADHDRGDHQAVKEGLKTLEGMKVGSEPFNDLLKKVMGELREHIESEEKVDFPLLEATMTQDVSASTAKSFQRTKMFVPTRPHPMAPTKPPFETLAGFLAAPLDKLKDAFSKFPSEQEKTTI